MLRTLTLGASALAILVTPIAAGAQVYQDRDPNARADSRYVDQRELREDRRDVREQRRELRDAQAYGSRDDIRDERRDLREARNERRNDRADWRTYRNYDYNRLPRGQSAYYADQYYRDGRYYQPRRLTANDRIYRGRDDRYYCRRPDGTTGLIIGGLSGGVLGNVIAPGGSKGLGTVLGGLGGALLGRSVDRNNITCR